MAVSIPNDRIFLTAEQAIAMLPEGDTVHVFLNPGVNILCGADWSREEVLELIQRERPELSGPEATRMGHGLVVCNDAGEPHFIETRPAAEG